MIIENLHRTRELIRDRDPAMAARIGPMHIRAAILEIHAAIGLPEPAGTDPFDIVIDRIADHIIATDWRGQ